MSILHICNTFFEKELANALPPNLEKAFSKNSIFLQLQFLPLVYAKQGDGLLVTDFPEKEEEFPLFKISKNWTPYEKISSWGYSLLVKEWADKAGIDYPMPPWDVVKMVNSRTYSFSKSPLPNSRLVYQGDVSRPGCVLKSCFSTSGSGLVLTENPKAQKFCAAEWKKGLPVIEEPWVERSLDFSTQWVIQQDKTIIFLGTTFCKTSATGIHISNTVGDTEKISAFADIIEEQKRVAYDALKEMAEMGFFGNVGFDAMIYDENKLQPIVEINARKTFGWVALMLQEQKYPGQIVELGYTSSEEEGILPKHLGNTQFKRQLQICSNS